MLPVSARHRLKHRSSLSLIGYVGVATVLFSLGSVAARQIPGRLFTRQSVTIKKMRPLKYSYIDKTGRIVIDAGRYQAIASFSESLAGINLATKGWGFTDKTGKVVIEPQFEGAGSFSEALAPVVIRGKWGFIDKTGRVVIKPEYDMAYEFSEGVAVAVKGDEGFLIDKTGRKILSRNNNQVGLDVGHDPRLSEGLIAAYDCAKRKIGFLDVAGDFVIEPKFVQAETFSEGLARVAVGGADGEERLGFIDRSGQFVIPPVFNTDAEFQRNSTNFSEGLASLTEGLNPTVTEEAKYVYIDKKGAIVLHTRFFFAGPYRDGLAAVYDEVSDKWGFIDKLGQVVVPVKYDLASDFSEGLACVAIQAIDE